MMQPTVWSDGHVYRDFIELVSGVIIQVEIHAQDKISSLTSSEKQEIMNLLLEPAKMRFELLHQHHALHSGCSYTEPQRITSKTVKVAYFFKCSGVDCHSLLVKTDSGYRVFRLFHEKLVAFARTASTQLPTSCVVSDYFQMSDVSSSEYRGNVSHINKSSSLAAQNKTSANPVKDHLESKPDKSYSSAKFTVFFNGTRESIPESRHSRCMVSKPVAMNESLVINGTGESIPESRHSRCMVSKPVAMNESLVKGQLPSEDKCRFLQRFKFQPTNRLTLKLVKHAKSPHISKHITRRQSRPALRNQQSTKGDWLSKSETSFHSETAKTLCPNSWTSLRHDDSNILTLPITHSGHPGSVKSDLTATHHVSSHSSSSVSNVAPAVSSSAVVGRKKLCLENVCCLNTTNNIDTMKQNETKAGHDKRESSDKHCSNRPSASLVDTELCQRSSVPGDVLLQSSALCWSDTARSQEFNTYNIHCTAVSDCCMTDTLVNMASAEINSSGKLHEMYDGETAAVDCHQTLWEHSSELSSENELMTSQVKREHRQEDYSDNDKNFRPVKDSAAECLIKETIILASNNSPKSCYFDDKDFVHLCSSIVNNAGVETEAESDRHQEDRNSKVRMSLEQYDETQHININELFDVENMSQVVDKPLVIEVEEDEEWTRMEQQIAAISAVADLSKEQLTYLVLSNERYLRDIFQGKRSCMRHVAYRKGGVERRMLSWMLPVGLFVYEQHEHILCILMELFCKNHQKYFDYLMRVLLPEILIKIVMKIHRLEHDDAERKMYEQRN